MHGKAEGFKESTAVRNLQFISHSPPPARIFNTMISKRNLQEDMVSYNLQYQFSNFEYFVPEILLFPLADSVCLNNSEGAF